MSSLNCSRRSLAQLLLPLLGLASLAAPGQGQTPAPVGIAVNLAQQELCLVQGDQVLRRYPVSTATRGPGSEAGSNRTPLGLHRVAQKIGAGAELGTVFVGRRPTGEIVRPTREVVDLEVDHVLTRILWLEGLEEGKNRGAGVDSKKRYIYIHGTSEEGLIGAPASHGCIRMHNRDVAELFELVYEGTRVRIEAGLSPEVLLQPLPEKCFGERAKGAQVQHAMLHFISDASENPRAPYRVNRVLGILREYAFSSHYLIDREGQIHKLVDESKRAFHAGKGSLPWDPRSKDRLNDSSIGIEILGMGSSREMTDMLGEATDRQIPKELRGFTDAQYEALQRLLVDLVQRYPELHYDRRHIVGHEDYAPGRKSDPGELFEWNRIKLPASPPVPRAKAR